MIGATLCSGIGAPECADPSIDWVACSEISSFPAAVHAAHFPKSINLGDMTTPDISKRLSELGPIDILVAGTPCFPQGTLILTRSGFKDIAGIALDDEVLTHRLRWRKVIATMRREADTVLIKGQGHSGLETTEEHPFWSKKVERSWIVGSKKAGGSCWERKASESEWTDAKDMKGRFWAMPAVIPETGIDIGRQLSVEFMWLVGAWIGDGWVKDTRKQAHALICANKLDGDFIQDRISAAGFTYWRSEERTTSRFNFGDRELVGWLKQNFGIGCNGKTLPAWLFSLDEELRQAFYDGYCFADGCQGKQPKGGGEFDRFTSVNKNLAIGIRILANTLGSASTICWCKPKRENVVIEGRVCLEQGFYQTTVYETSRSAFQSDNMWWGKVRSVKPTGRRCDVFNFEVEEDNSYVADGIVVHNCQAFSVAGNRLSLADARGNLTLRLCQIVEELDAIQPAGLPALVWENVPGVLSATDNAFGCFLGALVGSPEPLDPGPRPERGKSTRFWSWKEAIGEHRQKWPDAGYVAGVKRTVAWRCLDAQHFNLAQRRKRVFAVSCPVDGADPAQILFEFESVCQNLETSRTAQKAVAALTSSGVGTCGADDNQSQAGHLIPDPVISVALRGRDGGGMIEAGEDVAHALRASQGGGDKPHVLAFGGNNTKGPIDVATAVNAHGGPCGRMDFESETFAVVPLLEVGARTGTSTTDPRAGIGIGNEGDPMFTLQAGKQHGIATTLRARDGAKGVDSDCTDTLVPVAFKASHYTRGKDGAPSEVYPPLSCEADRGDQDPVVLAFHGSQDPDVSGDVTHPVGRNQGQETCIAFHENQRAEVTINDTMGTLNNGGGKPGQGYPAINHGMAVRRLMPVECERLQGFPDCWTDIVFKAKPAADGNRYKAIGNSMAVPVMRWILGRVQTALNGIPQDPPSEAGFSSP